MVKVRIHRTAGRVTGLTVSGHAGQAPGGEDIVCAAVSALVETLAIGLRQVVPGQAEWQVEDGHAEFRLSGSDPAQAAVVDTIAAGLADLAATYPNFVRIRTEER
jgi:uncharacterized protein YsxB (DUF464 family)